MKQMATHAQCNSAILLTANQLGVEVGFLSEAKQMLENKHVPLNLTLYIEREVRFALSSIKQLGLSEKADTIASEMLGATND